MRHPKLLEEEQLGETITPVHSCQMDGRMGDGRTDGQTDGLERGSFRLVVF